MSTRPCVYAYQPHSFKWVVWLSPCPIWQLVAWAGSGCGLLAMEAVISAKEVLSVAVWAVTVGVWGRAVYLVSRLRQRESHRPYNGLWTTDAMASISGPLKPLAYEALGAYTRECLEMDPVPDEWQNNWDEVAEGFRRRAVDVANEQGSRADRYKAFLDGLKELDEIDDRTIGDPK